MFPLRFAIDRTESVLSEIDRLKDADFPYGHSRDGLVQLEEVFKSRLKTLQRLTPLNHVAVIQTACSETLHQISRNFHLLGFVLRSTNVRNSFEIFGPLLRLARQVLGSDIRLIVSSEWEYTPHVYRPIAELPNFVLLGLPASESSNPLLIPLAGHELGHTTWQRRRLGVTQFEELISDSIRSFLQAHARQYNELFGGRADDLFVSQNLAPAHGWALRQAEESFCDFLGLRIFARAYLLSFAYLASPGGSLRSPFYPSIQDRVRSLLRASEKMGIKSPDGFSDWFVAESNPSGNEKEMFLLEVADAAREAIVDELIAKAIDIANDAQIPDCDTERIAKVLTSFALTTPASGIGDLASILNAAWQAYEDKRLQNGELHDKNGPLTELVLKSIEILEFEERLKLK